MKINVSYLQIGICGTPLHYAIVKEQLDIVKVNPLTI